MIKIFSIIFLFILDQVLKFLAIKNLLPDFGGIFSFTCNKAIAWGLPIEGILFWFFWTGAFLVVVFLLKKFRGDYFLFLVFFGAISNLLDRIFFGCVIDYISFFSFPIFNIADGMITIGMLCFAIKISLKNKSKK